MLGPHGVSMRGRKHIATSVDFMETARAPTPLRSWSPGKVSDELCVLAGHLQDHFNQQSFEDRCSGTVQVLIDMELLAHADYFVGSYNSRWPRVVQYLRYILYSKERDTSVDASAYSLDMFSNIRQIFRQDMQPQ